MFTVGIYDAFSVLFCSVGVLGGGLRTAGAAMTCLAVDNLGEVDVTKILSRWLCCTQDLDSTNMGT